MGANIGLHSIILSKLGYNVTSYEPDPEHLNQLKKNIKINCLDNMPIIYNEAVSVTNGNANFTRVIGNTTGSHLSGAKIKPYGKLEIFEVKTKAFQEIIAENNLIKVDVEGHEAEILCSTVRDHWLKTDAIVEVGTRENASRIYEHFKKINTNLFAQAIGWKKVESEHQMPQSYKDGSLFISQSEEMSWG